MFLGNDFHLDSWSTMSQPHHWITGWWQPRREHPLSIVEDDKLRPGEDVTSSKKTSQKFDEMCDSKISKSRWPTWQVLKIEKDDEKKCKPPPLYPRENTPSQKYPRNRRVVPSPSEDVPAASRTRRMAQEMKKLRSSHILRVPPSRSKTKARWHWRLMFSESIVPYLRFL